MDRIARFSPDTVERVKDAADIVEIVSAYSDLRQRGQDYWGLCPFHDERTPSFKVNPRDNLYYCFSCEASGDVIRFVEEKEGLRFPEAVESLGDRYGVETVREQEDPEAEARRKQRARLLELLERTTAFYAAYLRGSDEAGKARAYLAERGLSEETLADFDVGFAPNRWDTVLMRGQEAGFSLDELVASGLVTKGGRGPQDKFRARIMFPIRDSKGKVVGFGGRATRETQKAKYMNSPEGMLFHKSEILYGFDRARAAVAKAKRVVLAEGYTDVLALHQAGIENAVAVMGTALTEDQVKLLSGNCEELVLAMDADQAGQDAMIRAQAMAARRDLTLRVAAMPAGKDPADLIQAGEIENFQALLEGAVDYPEFRVEVALSRADLSSASGRERVLGEVAPTLKAMGEVVGRDELIRKVASRLDTDPGLVSRRVETAVEPRVAKPDTPKRGIPGREAEEAPTDAPTPRELRERALLAMCIAEPAAGKELLDKLADMHLSSPLTERTVIWLRDHINDPMAGLSRADDELVSLVTQLVMSSEREPASSEAMELNFLLLEQRALEDRISAVREKGDYEAAKKLSDERAALMQRIAGADRAA